MGEMKYVTDGPELFVTLLHVKRSKFWPLAERIWSNQEDRDDIVGDMITEAKKIFLKRVNRDETFWNHDENGKATARKAIINMVGIEIISAAELARLSFNEATYSRILSKAEKDVQIAINNLKPQRSPFTIVSIQPQMLDPDSDYPEDNRGG